MSPKRTGVIVLAFVWAMAAPATAQSLETISVPAGVLTVLEIPIETHRALALSRAIRVLHGAPTEGHADFESLMDGLDRLAAAVGRAGTSGISLDMANRRLDGVVLRDTIESLGLRLRDQRGMYSVETDSGRTAAGIRAVLHVAGIDSADIAQRLNAGEDVRIVPAAIDLPLPLSHETWTREVLRQQVPPPRLFSAIIRSRDASLLYYGLQAMTTETREYVARTDGLVDWLRGRAAVVAAFGGVFRVGRDGRVRVPGGGDAEALWENLAGEQVSNPDRFARALFGRDGGRLAYFAEALWALDSSRVRFALGLAGATREQQLDRFRALYDVFVRIDPVWSVSDAPFNRPSYDAALLLSVIAATPEGRLAAPAYQRLWERAFSGADLPAEGDRQMRDASADRLADAAYIAGLLAGKLPRERRAVIERVGFAQRTFSAAGEADQPDILIALRAYGRFPAVMATLERIGVRTPAVFARVARHAAAVDGVGVPDVLPLLTQFQGALALLGRLARTGAVREPVLEELVLSLSVVPIDGRRYDGGIAKWIRARLLPAIPGQANAAGEEERLLDALVDAFGIEARSFEWEGQTYALDSERLNRDLRSRRANQRVNSIDRLLALYGHMAALTSPATLEQIKAHTSAIARDAQALVPAQPWPEAPDSVPDLGRAIARTLRDLEGIRRERDVARAARAVRPLVDVLDYLLGESLAALAYAVVSTEAGRGAAAAIDIAHRHDFRLRQMVGVTRQPATWRRPIRGSELAAGDAVTGALLGLDLALARDRLRRLSTDALPQAPRLNANDRQAMAETVALMNARDVDDVEARGIADSIRRGRERVQEAAGSPDLLDALAEEGRLGSDRRTGLPWTARHDARSVLGLFSLPELFMLGGGRQAAVHAWGTSHERLTGCYCVRFPDGAGWDLAAGRSDTGQLGARMSDLNLWIAMELSELGLPAALFPSVMALATQDFADAVPMQYPDDWSAVASYVSSITRDRIEDYVSAVVAAGPFRVVEDGGSQ